MKEEILKVRDLNIYLKKIIEPIVKSPKAIRTGRDLNTVKLRPREVLGLFLICTIARYITNEDWTIGSDPGKRDGVVVCNSGEKEGDYFPTEQVYIHNLEPGNVTDLAISKIYKKSSKGENYGKDIHLIVYCDKRGKLNHQKIKNKVKNNDIFSSFWVIAKSSPNNFEYFVATIKSTEDPILAYKVTINNNFQSWEVKTLGKI